MIKAQDERLIDEAIDVNSERACIAFGEWLFEHHRYINISKIPVAELFKIYHQELKDLVK